MPQNLPNLPDFVPDQTNPGANLPDFIPDQVGGASFQQRAQPTQGPLPQADQWHQMPDQGPGWWDQVKQNFDRMQNPHMGRGGGANVGGNLDQMARWGSETGGSIGRGIRMPGEVPGQDQPSYDPGPQVQGAAAAMGGLVGGLAADPRQIGLMAGMGGASLPIRAAADVGFGAQMGYGANEQAGEMGKHWNELTPEQLWEMGSSAGLQTLMAGFSGAGAHESAMEGLQPHLTENLPDFIPDQTDPGTHSGVQEPRLNVRQQAPSTAMPSRPAGGQVAPPQAPNTGVEGGPSATMASSQMGGASVGQSKAPGVRGEDILPAHMTEGLVSPQNLPEFIPDAQSPIAQTQAAPTTGPQQTAVQAPQAPRRFKANNQAPIAANVPLTAPKPSIDEVAANPPSFSEGSTPEVFRPRKKAFEPTTPSPEAQKTKTPPRSVEEVVKGISPSARPKKLPDEELANLVNLGEKGAQQAGLSRDDYLAARAEHRRRTAGQTATPQAPEAPKEPGQDVHQSITRIAKASDETDRGRRQNEFLETIRGVSEEHKPALSDSLRKRSEDVGKQASELERINSAKDFAKEVSTARHASELVATGGPETELDAEGQPIKQKFQRQFPIGEEERQYLGYLAGNKQERFKFLRDDSGKAIRTGELDPERQKFADELRDRLEKHRAEVLAQPGGRPTEAQKAEGIRLVTGLQAATGRRQLYSGKGQEGLDPDRAYWNKLMGRPETSHFSKPDEATLSRRLKQLRDESELSKLASEHLRGERRQEQQGAYAGPERRKTWSEIDKENQGPSEGEKLGKEIRAARAEKPSGLSEGEVRQRIMRDPVKYEEFRKADRKTQDAMLVKASREEAPKAPEEKPVDATKARASEDLEQAYQHLVNLHRKGQGSTKAAERVREAIAELRPHAPGVKVPAELEASEVLRASEKPKDRVIDRESTTPETPKTGLADALWEKLRTSEEIPGALRGAIHKLHAEETSVVAKEDRDNLAYVIPDGLKDMEVARRYGGALKIAGDDLKAGRGLERAENFARTGSQRTSPRTGEEGFASLGGRRPGSKSEPSPSEHVKDIIKDETHRNLESRKLAEGLDDLGSMNVADVLRAVKIMKERQGTRADYENIYHWLENRDKETLTPKQVELAQKEILPLYEENARIYQKLSRTGIAVEDYVHRIPLKKASRAEMILAGRRSFSPGAVMSKASGALKGRKYEAMIDPSGQRHIVTEKAGILYGHREGQMAELGRRKEWTKTGHKFGEATTKEIEQHTPTRYLKHGLGNTLMAYVEMRRAERAYDMLEAYKKTEDFKVNSLKVGKGTPPKGWKLTSVPQLREHYFEPHTAEVLDRYWNRVTQGDFGAFAKLNRFLRTSIFFNPMIHIPNISVHWVVEKGLRGFLPDNWVRLAKTTTRALDIVSHPYGEDYIRMLDEGAALQGQRQSSRTQASLLWSKMFQEFHDSPTVARKISDALGYAHPVNMVKALYNFSGRATWLVDDVMRIQAALERVDRNGLTMPEAMKEVSRHLPNYRLPTRIFDSRELGRLMENPNLTMFGAYHYGALKSYGEMIKDVAKYNIKDPKKSLESLDKMAMIGLITFVIYPAMDQLAKQVTGEKNAYMRRAGASTFVYNLNEFLHGRKGLTPAVTSVVTPAPLPETVLSGYESGMKPKDVGAVAKDVGSKLLGKIGPVSAAQRSAPKKQPINWKHFFWNLAGVQFKNPTGARRSDGLAKVGGLSKLAKVK